MPRTELWSGLTRLRRFIIDVLILELAFWAVAALPVFHWNGPGVERTLAIYGLIYAFAAAGALWLTHTYRMIWRYVSFRDILYLLQATALSVVIFGGIELVLSLMIPMKLPTGTKLSMFLMMLPLGASFLALPRVIARAIDELCVGFARNNAVPGLTVPALIAGDVPRIEAFIRETRRVSHPRHRIVGVLSDDPKLISSYLQGVRVLGPLAQLSAITRMLGAHGQQPVTLILAMDDADRAYLDRVLSYTVPVGLKIERLAPARTFQDGMEVQPLSLADLLGRDEIKVDFSIIGSMVENKRVLVTGGGGSIGSELCRQLACLNPSKIFVGDICEYNLYAIDKELTDNFPHIAHQSTLIDIRDTENVRNWITSAQPDVVFHAAALKHVPLLEDHPIEAVKTNILGTVNVANACYELGVQTMVTISTDKAVNPCNIMGATKRLAEAYCQGLDQSSESGGHTRFITVRFGNVLGSAGSVVPLFKRQINAGGPVTVTDRNIERYFMTIPEAVRLVLQAGAQGLNQDEERGSIYVLEMGKAVKIFDLAKQMIQVAGYRPDIDIKIEFIGLRPGEKLYEELAYGDERVLPTRGGSVLKLKPRVTDLRIIRQQVQELRQACTVGDPERVIRVLGVSVPEYVPWPNAKTAIAT